MSPDNFTSIHVLNACASLWALGEGRHVHVQIVESSCDSIYEAWRSLGPSSTNIPSCDVISWNLTILGHVKCGQGQKTLKLCQQMQQEQV
jgi:hypothetical protein